MILYIIIVASGYGEIADPKIFRTKKLALQYVSKVMQESDYKSYEKRVLEKLKQNNFSTYISFNGGDGQDYNYEGPTLSAYKYKL
jgi:hypothetical protein